MTPSARVDRWEREREPTREELEQRLAQEGLSFYRWSNGPNFRYAAHEHAYDKVIYVAEGSITFGLPDGGEQISLRAGDRLELDARTRHDAVVGPKGVVCLEAHR